MNYKLNAMKLFSLLFGKNVKSEEKESEKYIFQKANSMKTDKFHCDEQTFFIVLHMEMKSNIITSVISREM